MGCGHMVWAAHAFHILSPVSIYHHACLTTWWEHNKEDSILWFCKSMFNWLRVRHHRLSSMVKVIPVFHWSNTAHSPVTVAGDPPWSACFSGYLKLIAASLTIRSITMHQTDNKRKKEWKIQLILSQAEMCETCTQVYLMTLTRLQSRLWAKQTEHWYAVLQETQHLNRRSLK